MTEKFKKHRKWVKISFFKGQIEMTDQPLWFQMAVILITAAVLLAVLFRI